MTGKIGAGLVLAALLMGCRGRQTAEQALEAQLKQAGITRHAVFPLAGRVTIDGQPPGSDTNVVVVMLNDVAKPDAPLKTRRRTTCEPNGEFSFSTYLGSDGIAPGEYILTFAMLAESRGGLFGPDQLKNRFNDPEKNKDIPEYRLDHKDPGRKDYAFDLVTNGKDAVATAGKFALTELVDQPRNTNRNRQ